MTHNDHNKLFGLFCLSEALFVAAALSFLCLVAWFLKEVLL